MSRKSDLKRTVLVLYYTRGVYPLRNTIETHLYCWKKYLDHHFIYINVAFGFPEKYLRHLNIDAVIFHTSFLGMRWQPAIFERFTKKCNYLKTLDCQKIGLPQDEFLHTKILNDFYNEFGITHLLTLTYEQDWPLVFDTVDREKVSIQQVLPGYLDPDTCRRVEAYKKTIDQRPIGVGYRAWKAQYWLGEHGMQKVWIAEQFERACQKLGIRSDISLRDEDVLNGDDWFKFLLSCQTVIGVEGGASICDQDGQIKARVEEYLAAYPEATFEETRRACFAEDDNKLHLKVGTPRHLESCLTETCQILQEGTYTGVLTPWVHYIPVKKDFSNVEEVLGLVIADEAKVREIVANAYGDIVISGKYTYKAFVEKMDQDILQQASVKTTYAPVQAFLSQWIFTFRDWFIWRFIQMEHHAIIRQTPSKLLMKVYQKCKKFVEKTPFIRDEDEYQLQVG